MRMKSIGSAALVLFLVTSAFAGKEIVVKVGATADATIVSTNHNVTTKALKKAKAEGGDFWVKDSKGASHPFHLDAKQVGDLMDGSMVMVDETGAASPARITIVMNETEDKAAEKSGW